MTFLQKVRAIFSRGPSDFIQGLANRSNCEQFIYDEMYCDINHGHEGLHQHDTGGGIWVWSTNKRYLTFVKPD